MALPIRQRLSALTCLKAGPKAVLIEVCELAENGGKSAVTASNAYLAQRLGASERTVSRVLSDLERIGFVLVSERQGKARQMLPSPAVRLVYSAAQPSQNSLDNLAKMAKIGEVEPSQNGSQPSQNGSANLAKNGEQPSQNGSRVLGDDQNDQLDDQDDQQRNELVLAQKKIVELATQLNEALDSLATCRATITTLRAEAEASRTRGAAGALPIASVLPYASQEFAACWQDYRAAQGIAPNSPRERALLKSLAGIAATETEALATVNQAIRKGWKDLYKLDEPRPDSHSQRPAAANGRGAKPTGTGALGARALAEHFAALDAAAAGASLYVVSHGAATGFDPH